MFPVTIPTPELLVCVLNDIIDCVGFLCRRFCHVFHNHLIVNEVQCLLKNWSCVLDEQGCLHLLCHGSQELKIVLLFFCHGRQAAIFGTLSIFEEPRL